MKTVITFISVFAVAVALTGCFPMRFTKRPGVSGSVVDSQTRMPISGAEVFFTRAPYTFYRFTNTTVSGRREESKTAPRPQPPQLDFAISNALPPFVLTDANGRFAIPPITKWGIYIMPMDVFPVGATLVVRRDGYAPELRTVPSVSSMELDVLITKTN
jgi:hypothetical protein